MGALRQDLRSRLDSELSIEAPGNAAILLDVLDGLDPQQLAVPLLQALLKDRNWLEEVANRSYAHTNGFDKLVLLASDAPAYKLRFHIWWPNDQEDANVEDVHNHRWDFASVLVHGDYLYEEYHRATSGQPFGEYLYLPRGGAEQFALRKQGVANLKCVFRCNLACGSGYGLSSDVLHRVARGQSGLTATFMLQGRATADQTSVFVSEGKKVHASVEAPALSLRQLQTRIERYLNNVT